MAENRRKLLSLVTALLLFIGTGMLLYAFLWPEGDKGASQWTVEHASQKRDVAAKAHQLSLSPELATSTEVRDELMEARDAYEQLEAARLQAIDASAQAVLYVRWTGIGLVTLGVGLYLQQRNQGQPS